MAKGIGNFIYSFQSNLAGFSITLGFILLLLLLLFYSSGDSFAFVSYSLSFKSTLYYFKILMHKIEKVIEIKDKITVKTVSPAKLLISLYK